MTAAASLISEFDGEAPTLAILKHTNPCGAGQGQTLREAWDKAYATDKQAPFGGIIAVNRTLDLACAEAISEIFSEVIVAPDFAPDALELLKKKKNLRMAQVLKSPVAGKSVELRGVGADSLLAQERDDKKISTADLRIVTKRQPTEVELYAMLFGWKIVKNVKSVTPLKLSSRPLIGRSALATATKCYESRGRKSRIAVWKAQEAGLSLAGCAVCSDAFFFISMTDSSRRQKPEPRRPFNPVLACAILR